MRSPLDALITEKSLVLVNRSESHALLESAIDEGNTNIPLVNVCAKVSKSLSDEIDDICTILGISKRRFLEAAMVQAIGISRTIMEEERVFTVLEGHDHAHA